MADLSHNHHHLLQSQPQVLPDEEEEEQQEHEQEEEDQPQQYHTNHSNNHHLFQTQPQQQQSLKVPPPQIHATPPPPPPPPPPAQPQPQPQPPRVLQNNVNVNGNANPAATATAIANGSSSNNKNNNNGRTSIDDVKPLPSRPAVKYRECQRNHAASIGAHAVDGCGEFMPAGPDGTPEAFKCQACNCHRNFHRQETEGAVGFRAGFNHCSNNNTHNHGNEVNVASAWYLDRNPPLVYPNAVAAAAASSSGPDSPSQTPPPPSSHFQDHHPAQMLVSLSGARGSSLSKKRFRTKFTAEQKDRMHQFADRLGWRIQKQDEAAVQQFCSEVGVKRHVLKVWMHNNKHTLAKKSS